MNNNLFAYISKKIMLLSHPVGCIYTSVSSTSPAELFGGTWERIGEGKCLIDAGTTYTAGSTGGSADAIIPYHTHTFVGSAVTSGNNSVGHTHTFTTGNPSANHTHGCAGSVNINVRNATGKSSISNDYGLSGYQYVTSTGTAISKNNFLSSFSGGTSGTVSAWHTHSGTTNGISANHTHSVTAAGSNSYAGTSGNVRGANMQPYLAVYMWKRTA